MSHENEHISNAGDGSQVPPPPLRIQFPPEAVEAFRRIMQEHPITLRVPTAVQGDDRTLDPDLTQIIPRAEGYDYTHAEGEEADRLGLLRETMIDEHGLAVVSSLDHMTTTRLAAVKIVDGDASLVPLRLQRGQLLMDVPDDRPTEIGFFVGFDRSPVSAVVRAGEYPGIPLTTEQVNPKKVKEILLRMRGIRENELDEQRWAEQIDTTALGLHPGRMRGIFAKSHREDANSTVWKNQRLAAVPFDQRDLLKHFDAYYVAPSKIQILTYSSLPPQQRFQPPPVETDHLKMATQTRQVGLGFGGEYTMHATTSGTHASRLSAAFDIRLSPIKA